MPTDTKIDPFKPQQPSIPGVAPKAESAKAEPSDAVSAEQPAAAAPSRPVSHEAKPQIILMVLGAAVAVFLIGGLILWGQISSHKSMPAAPVAAVEPPAAPEAKPAPSEPMGPGPIATVSELSKPWASKRFQYKSYVTSQVEPAMVVHLPHGDYWGFSLIEPFGNCELDFVTDLDQLRTTYGYRADHPMVVDPCNKTVYDLLRYGGGASADDLVRGVIVQGGGLRPPMAIEIRVQGGNVVAGRSE
jgi:hypothetical protein